MFSIIKRKYTNLASDARFAEIFTGSIWALSARLVATGFGLIASIIIARIYGAEVMGIVALLNSFLLLATILTVLGTDTSILRLIPEHIVRYSPKSAFQVYRKTQFMVIGMSLITGAFFFLGANHIAGRLFNKPHLSFYFALASVFILFKSLMLFNTHAVRGLRLIRVFSLMQVAPQGFNLFLLLLLGVMVSASDVPVYAQLGAYALAGILGWAIMAVAFKKKMKSHDKLHPMPARKILAISLPMLMTTGMAFIIGQTGVIILGMFRSDAEVGYYAIAVKLATLTVFILNATNSMAGPKFSELFHLNKMDELFYVARKSAKLIFWTTVPILLGLIFLGRPVLHYVFGIEFVIAYPALVLLVLGQFVNSVSGSTGLFMNMTGNQKVFRNIMVLAATTNIILNFLLIPKHGIHGAAVAAMICISGWNMFTLIYIKMKFRKTTGYFPLLVRL